MILRGSRDADTMCWGTMLIADHAGTRAMLTHPIDGDAARFYTLFGFIASPLREQQWLLLLQEACRWVR